VNRKQNNKRKSINSQPESTKSLRHQLLYRLSMSMTANVIFSRKGQKSRSKTTPSTDADNCWLFVV